MNIVEHNRERLHIRHVPWIAGGVTFLLGALGVLDVLIDIDDDLEAARAAEPDAALAPAE